MVWRGAAIPGRARQGSVGAPSRVAVLQHADKHAQACAGHLGQVFNVDAVARWKRVDDGGTCNADVHGLNAQILSSLSLPAKPPQWLGTAVH